MPWMPRLWKNEMWRMATKAAATRKARGTLGKKQKLTGRTYEHLAALEPVILRAVA